MPSELPRSEFLEQAARTLAGRDPPNARVGASCLLLDEILGLRQPGKEIDMQRLGGIEAHASPYGRADQ